MSIKNSWQEFFNAHAPVYGQNVFVSNTLREIEFIIEELLIDAGASILDVGCGTGRHSIELAKRGFSVTGLDLSSGMLAEAAEAAKRANVNVEWIQANATDFSFPKKFDAAICLCEGAFGLLGVQDDPVEQPLSILRNVSNSLKPGAKALFTVLNGTAMFRKHSNEDVQAGRFDPLSLVESSEHSPREGLPPIKVRERGFAPAEFFLLGRFSGMSVLNIWGGTAGNWGRRSVDLDEIEIMIVMRKSSDGGILER